MKRIVAIILSALCIVSLVACESKTTQELPKSEVAITEENDNTEAEIQSSSDVIMDTTPTLTWKMAKLHQDEKKESINLWFVVEFDDPHFFLDRKNPFVIINETTEEEITNNIDKYDVEVFVGSVCQNNHAAAPDGLSAKYNMNDDCRQYTVRISALNKLKFDDLHIIAYPKYYLNKTEAGKMNPTNLSFNADISDITTKHTYLHDNTLFQVEDNYYISPNSHSVHIDKKNGEYGMESTLVGVNGDPMDLLAMLRDNSERVWGPFAENFQKKSGYNSLQYLNAIDKPEGVEDWVKIESEGAHTACYIGYRVLSDTDIPNQDKMIAVSHSFVPKLKVDDHATVIMLMSKTNIK